MTLTMETEMTSTLIVLEARLTNYKYLQDDVAPILKLALWNAKNVKQSNDIIIDHDESITMFQIIFQTVTSFLDTCDLTKFTSYTKCIIYNRSATYCITRYALNGEIPDL